MLKSPNDLQFLELGLMDEWSGVLTRLCSRARILVKADGHDVARLQFAEPCSNRRSIQTFCEGLLLLLEQGVPRLAMIDHPASPEMLGRR